MMLLNGVQRYADYKLNYVMYSCFWVGR